MKWERAIRFMCIEMGVSKKLECLLLLVFDLHSCGMQLGVKNF